ncbi:hypothetical protein HY489_01520 [Candidatus Woesearchaeota archaeon]|nr:hypothetical protein [Candidatus Woesearchaeota archaeon]
MLTPTEVTKIKEELDTAKRPLFLYHDDPDGLASFLLCYRYLGEGRGLPVKAYPRIAVDPFARKVTEYEPDKVFVLDVAMVDQEFIDAVNIPVIWIDHHALLQRDNVQYFNPQKRGVNIPTPELIWQVVSETRPQDLWIAVTGAIGDWHFPAYAESYQAANPAILPKTISTPERALYETEIGILVKVFSFCLKGQMNEVQQAVKTLTRINDPEEILRQTTPQGKYLWKKYITLNKEYEQLKERALKHASKDKLFVWTYQQDKLSLTKDLANELLYLLKDKIVILGREKEGEYRCSLRAPANIPLSKALEKALIGVQGYGGGHEQACGAAIKKDDWERFLGNLRKELKL